MTDLSSVTTPVDLIRCLFEDAEPGSVRILEVRPLIPSIVLQSVSDGRVSIYLNNSIFVGTLKPLAERFLSYFDRFHIQASCTVGRETFQIDGPLELPNPCTSVKLTIAGFFQCSVLFSVVSQLPKDVSFPLVLVGFSAPRDSQRLQLEFEDYLVNREFPCLDVKAISRQRVRLESRNRDFLLQTSKTRQELMQRHSRADQSLQRRAEQIEVLAREVEGILKIKVTPTVRVMAVERTIERIDRAINDVAGYAGKLEVAVNGKAEGRPMTRKEELTLLEQLKNQVRETRQQLDALNEQITV
jgi:hypothetical protein